MELGLLAVVAAILIAIKLPTVLHRLELSKRDRILFILMLFTLLGLGWFAVYAIGMSI